MARDVKTSRKRVYRSPLREAQTLATRRRILDAATTLFVNRGFVATTMRNVADVAQVGERTVFAVFGSKRAILFSAIDAAIAGDDEATPVSERDWFKDVLQEPDPDGQLRLLVVAAAAIHERTWQLFNVLQEAALTDSAVKTMWQAHAKGHVKDVRLVADSLANRKALRDGLDIGEVVDILWVFTSPQFYALVAEYRRWSRARYIDWASTSLSRLLLP